MPWCIKRVLSWGLQTGCRNVSKRQWVMKNSSALSCEGVSSWVSPGAGVKFHFTVSFYIFFNALEKTMNILRIKFMDGTK